MVPNNLGICLGCVDYGISHLIIALMTLGDPPHHFNKPQNRVSQRGLNFLRNIIEFEPFNGATLDSRLDSSSGSALFDSCVSSPPNYILHNNHK